MIRLKTEKQIQGLKESGAIASEVLRKLKKAAKVGVSLKFLDELARTAILERGAKPAFLGYRPEGADKPYPATICASINDVIVHGIPDSYKLLDGDIVSLDIGVEYKGLIVDTATTIGIGKLDKDSHRLIRATKMALERGIKQAQVGKRLGDIGAAIEGTAKRYKVKIVEGLTGHGVGFELHEDPVVLNYGRANSGIKLEEGMVIAIEPMFSLGSARTVYQKNGSFRTADESPSAHFEHTIAITKDGPIVLTK
ncbi:MAG: type I methionyl aminopeptidase [Candidatus Colwellbacteria bacterium RIFCSPHIGHO2_12_FULL_44_17]|uniref:Methionine aminopeptidase n=1 Tax=Candidatus Colwellbacteria bacterium RIFCSPHIGHO2_12_FULL_44_17 TaxID=1797689 RepID=A0A1G1Z545_9BACT|nr:MAG: type I methionyl aminopeptidase [Candidatus Colwellbacteria bacterium RIFCSPHIGHO2_12_FULL_44_17]